MLERFGWVFEGLASGLPAFVAAASVIVYGLLAVRLMGIRSWLLALAAAIPSTIALVIIGAQLVGMLGISAPIVAHALVGLGIAGLLRAATLVRHSWRTTRTTLGNPDIVVWGGVAIGIAVGIAVWAGGIGDLVLPPQGHDDIWHGYLVERLTHMPLVTADTVAPTLADKLKPAFFYQYGLHLALAFAHSLTGASVAEALNGAWGVLVAVATPCGCAALAWSLFPGRRWVAFWAAALAPGVVIFPYLTNGLLPYTASLAIAPAFLALLVTFVAGERSVPPWGPALAAVGVFVTHPSGAVAAAIMAAFISLEIIVTAARRGAALVVMRRLAAVCVVAFVAATPWLFAAGERGPGRSPAFAQTDLASAISHVAVLGTPWTSAQPVLALLVGAGIVATVVRRRAIGLSAAYVTFAVLTIGTMAGIASFAALTTPWHAHWYRIAAALGVVVPVLAGFGIASAIALVRERLAGASGARRSLTAAATAVVVLVSAMGGAYASAQGQSIIRDAWHSTQLIEPSDIELFSELAAATEPGDRVFNSPRDGSGWMYAMYGVIPSHPYVYGTPLWSWDLVDGVKAYRSARVACSALADEQLTHAIVKQVTVPGAEPYDIGGFVERHGNLFVEIARTQSAVAYRIDQEALRACIDG